MQLPLTDPETLFEELLQDLPPETRIWRGNSKPLCGPRRGSRRYSREIYGNIVKTPVALLPV